MLKIAFLLLLRDTAAAHPEKNWYDDLPNVKVLQADDASNQKIVDTIWRKQANAHFAKDRYAIILKPGKYKVPFGINVGYYTSVIGAGKSPYEVELSWVACPNGKNGHATNNFWRSVEGVKIKAPDITWAVSQASPIRRSVIEGNLHLSHAEKYSSGGFIADTEVHGKLFMGTQQQWMFRNVNVWRGLDCPSGWNYVFAGQQGISWAEQQKCSGLTPGKVIDTPLSFAAEKPFLVLEDDDKWYIHVPKFVGGISGAHANIVGNKLTLEDEVFITRPGMDSDDITKGMTGKKGLLVTPGVYELKTPIEIKESNFVVLGIGFPTLVATDGEPAVKVAGGLRGVRVAGLLLEAGTPKGDQPTKPLLLWGDEVSNDYTLPGPASGAASDIFARVGSFAYRNCPIVRADTMLQINSDDVVLDHLWLWHADHDDCGTELEVPGKSDECHSEHGLVVNGRRVTSFGLAAEHTVGGDMVVWNGEEGDVYFYQSEVPYHQSDWGAKGYAGYTVAPHVEYHSAHGVGVYVIASELNQTVRSAFLLPPYAKVFSLFQVIIGGENQFRNLACVQGSASCYRPTKCTPMRCWTNAFPTQKLPPARVRALELMKVRAKEQQSQKKTKADERIQRNQVLTDGPPAKQAGAGACRGPGCPRSRGPAVLLALPVLGLAALSAIAVRWGFSRRRSAGQLSLVPSAEPCEEELVDEDPVARS